MLVFIKKYHKLLTIILAIFVVFSTFYFQLLNEKDSTVEAAFEIDNSLRFNDDDSPYLSRTPSSAGNRTVWTWSGWVKLGNISTLKYLFAAGTDGSNESAIRFNADDTLQIDNYVGGATKSKKVTTAVYRDPGTWSHIVVSVNGSTQNMYVDGVQITNFSTNTTDTSNWFFNNTDGHKISGRAHTTGSYIDGYLSDVHFIDGQALTPSSFGETNTSGQWVSKAYSGTYGTNGYHLDFANSTDLGNDVSGQNNDWTSTNLDATDQVIDTPTNNFAVLNGVVRHGSNTTLSDGNLVEDWVGANWQGLVPATLGTQSGKYYMEVAYDGNATYSAVGVTGWGGLYDSTPNISACSIALNNDDTVALRAWGTSYTNLCHDTTEETSWGTAITDGDVTMMAWDVDTKQVWFGKNGIWENSGDPANGTNEAVVMSGTTELIPFISSYSNPMVVNFGANAQTGLTYDSDAGGYFKYTPPTGFKALSTANLPTPAITKPSDHFDIATYTGNGSTQSITGLDFQPDLVWLKDRTSANSHGLFDIIRSTTKLLSSDATSVESTDADTLTSFDSTGFSLGADTKYNTNTNNYVAWNWKAGGTASSNTDGSITSSVSANPTAGFSIVSYTGNGTAGATVGHGLNDVPEMVIIKNRDGADDWAVYANEDGTDYLQLNSTAATADNNTYWNDTNPSSSVITLGTNSDVNNNSENLVAYAFHSVPSYSKIGSYTGNGSADGPFAYTGFKPRYVMVKRTDTTGNWQIIDLERSPAPNPARNPLYADVTDAESTGGDGYPIDYNSNGFKIRSTEAVRNASGGTYIYYAIAEYTLKPASATSLSVTPLWFGIGF